MNKRFAGIDIGSRTIELVVVNDAGEIVRSLQTDKAGNKTLDAKVVLNEPCPFCGQKHVYHAGELSCPFAGSD